MASFSEHYKELKTSRGFNYRYYFSAPKPGAPSVLFLHGFPSLALDWHGQAAYFKAKGYGVIIPDMLGYGGTDKPEELSAYLHSGLSKDLLDIVDHEKVPNVLVVGHDWGCKTTSALANYYPDRFLGFGFLAVGYLPPNTSLTYEQLAQMTVQSIGRETIGYWEFFAAPDANEVILKHLDSFLDVIHVKDPRLWRTNMCPKGSIRIFLESDSRSPRLSVPTELMKAYEENIKTWGIQGGLNYYRVAIGPDREDSKQVPLDRYKVDKPVFFGATTKDEICLPEQGRRNLGLFCPNATIHEFDTGHWVAVEAPDELNEQLDKWITSVIAL